MAESETPKPRRPSISATPPMGQFLGVDVYPFGSGAPDAPAVEWPTPYGTVVGDPQSALSAILRYFSTESVVIVAAGLSALKAAGSPKLEAVYGHASSLPWFLVRRLVTEAILARTPGREETGPPITLGWFQRALTCLMDCTAEPERTTPPSRDSIMPSLNRLVQAQLHDQADVRGFYRDWWIVDETHRRLNRAGIDLERAYRSTHGVSFTELASLCFGVYAAILGNPESPILPRGWGIPNPFNYDARTVEAFLRTVSVGYAQFASEASGSSVTLPGAEPFALSPLVMWPLIALSDGRMAAPSVLNVLERVTRTFKVELQKVLPLNDIGAAGRLFGEAYEDYVEQTLVAALGPSALERVPRRPNSKTCDFLIKESDRLTLLVEAKALHFPLRVEMTKSPESLREFFLRPDGLADAILQLDATANNVRSGQIPGRRRTYVCGLVVLHGDAVFMNTREVKGILLEAAAARNRGRAPTIPFQVANDLDFESLVQIPANDVTITSWLYDKATAGGNTSAFAEMDIAVALGSLRNRPPHPLADKMAAHFKEMLARAGLDISS